MVAVAIMKRTNPGNITWSFSKRVKTFRNPIKRRNNLSPSHYVLSQQSYFQFVACLDYNPPALIKITLKGRAVHMFDGPE